MMIKLHKLSGQRGLTWTVHVSSYVILNLRGVAVVSPDHSSAETTLVSFGALCCHNYVLSHKGVQFSLWHLIFYIIAREISVLQ